MGIFATIGKHLLNNKDLYIPAAVLPAGAVAVDKFTGEQPEPPVIPKGKKETERSTADKVYDMATDTLASGFRGVAKTTRGISDAAGYVIPKMIHPTQDPNTTKRNLEQGLANFQETVTSKLPQGAKDWMDTPLKLNTEVKEGKPGDPEKGLWEGRMDAAVASGKNVINNMGLSQGAVAEGGTAVALSTVLAVAARKKLPVRIPGGSKTWNQISPVMASNQALTTLRTSLKYSAPIAAGSAATSLALVPGTTRPVEKNNQDYEGDKKAVEDARAKWKLENDTNKRLYGYKPHVAAAVGSLVGGTLGYYMSDDNKFLWSVVGTLLGGAAPYAVKAVMDKTAEQVVPSGRSAVPVVQETAPMSETVADTAVQQAGVLSKVKDTLKRVDWKTLWDQHKYDIGAGAAAGLGVAGSIKAYNDPESRWWSVPGSAGLLGSAYYLARRGNDERRIQHTSINKLKQKDYYGKHPSIGSAMPMVKQMESEMGAEQPGASKVQGLTTDQVNTMLWKLEAVGKTAKKENWSKEQRMKKAMDTVSDTFEQSPVFSDKSPEAVAARRQYTDTLNTMLEATESGNPITAGTSMMGTAKEFAASSNPDTAAGKSAAVKLPKEYMEEAGKLYPDKYLGDPEARKQRIAYVKSKTNAIN